MKTITNISVSQQALPILIREWEGFLPRVPGDVFALAYMSSFTNPDGTTVDGFRPGYSRHSVSPQGLGAMWARAQPRHAPEFLFMPKFIWSASEQYLIDVACLPYQLLSIGPTNKQ